MSEAKTCRTCQWWTDDDAQDYTMHPIDEDTYEEKKMPFIVRRCLSPRLLFCERPIEPTGFAIADASGYKAFFYTGEAFYCPNHEEPSDDR